MLAGVGGRTVEEAKERLSFAEAIDWFSYRRTHGPLLMIERLEMALAQVALVTATSMGGKKKSGGRFTISDFLPGYGKPARDSEREATLEDLKSMFKARRK